MLLLVWFYLAGAFFQGSKYLLVRVGNISLYFKCSYIGVGTSWTLYLVGFIQKQWPKRIQKVGSFMDSGLELGFSTNIVTGLVGL